MNRLIPLVLATGTALIAMPASAQKAVKLPPSEIVSQQISTSRNAASLRIELGNNRAIDVAIRGGKAFLNGTSVGDAPRDSDLDRSFRELLREITDSPSEALPRLLTDWSPEGSTAATKLDRALEDAVRGIIPSEAVPADADVAANADAPDMNGVPAIDSVDKLNERINELESMVDDMNDNDMAASARITGRNRWAPGPLHSLMRGLGDILSVLVIYFILFVIAVAVIAFGGRKYIEGVADTARKMTMRSWLVGLAATFLVIPAFVLGLIALTISIVGIPALLAWVPLYPLAVIASLALGYLAVAHAAGESLAERRFYVNDWFKRGNSYYFLLSGIGLLLAAFVAAGIVEMAGAWLGFIRGLLLFLGVVTTWTAFTIGFGAVLVSRAGTRPLGKIRDPLDEPFVEDPGND